MDPLLYSTIAPINCITLIFCSTSRLYNKYQQEFNMLIQYNSHTAMHMGDGSNVINLASARPILAHVIHLFLL